MMKKIVSILLPTVVIFALVLLSTSCASDNETTTPSSSAYPSVAASEPSASSDTATPIQSTQPAAPSSGGVSPDTSDEPSPSPSTTPTEDTPSPTDASGVLDYFMLGSTLIETDSIGPVSVNMSESDLTAALGQPDIKTELELWGADDQQHATWIYVALGLYVGVTQADAGSEVIVFSIDAIAPCSFETQRGIKTGDSRETVLAAYAQEYNAAMSTEEFIVLGSIYGGILIVLSEGAVVSIFIGSSAE